MKPSSMLFTIIGDYYHQFDMKVWVGSLITYLKQFQFNEGTIRVTLTRLSQQGLLDSIKVGQKSFYYVTPKGRKRITEGTSRVYHLKDRKWDGQWRIVFYNFPESLREKRDQFRKELQWNGFACKENNVWISPHNSFSRVIELIEEYEIQEYVDFFTARYDGPKNYRNIAHKAWNLEEIENAYKSFLNQFEKKYEEMYRLFVRDELKEDQCFKERAILVHEYRKFLFIDPRLPKEMLPSQWIGDEAWEFFKDFHLFLSQKAEKFFYDHLVLPKDVEKQKLKTR